MDETRPKPPRLDRFRTFSLRKALSILLAAVAAAAAIGIQPVGLTFNPGWANDWPGVSLPTAFASVITGLLSAAALASGAAAVVVPCHYLERSIGRDYIGWSAFAVLMLTWTAVVAMFTPVAFDRLRRTIAQELS